VDLGAEVKPYYEHAGITIYHGDCREVLPTNPIFGYSALTVIESIHRSRSGTNSAFDSEEKYCEIAAKRLSQEVMQF
jgi:hypothetical protein